MGTVDPWALLAWVVMAVYAAVVDVELVHHHRKTLSETWWAISRRHGWRLVVWAIYLGLGAHLFARWFD